MSKDGSSKVVQDVIPSLPSRERALITALVSSHDGSESLSSLFRSVSRRWRGNIYMRRFCAIALVLADLLDQGWGVEVTDRLRLIADGGARRGDERAIDAKHRVQAALRVGRDRQLAEPSVQAFLQRTESQTAHHDPISKVISEGAELAHSLEAFLASEDASEASFSRVIEPYVQVCETDEKCAYTGLRLLDIWRYFRHSWSLEYRPVPGRAMPLLIRNRALPNHPVMGIAMLASPVMKLRKRDAWLGLSIETVEKLCITHPALRMELRSHLLGFLEASIDCIRHDDLLTIPEMENPTRDILFRLERLASGAAAKREEQLRSFRENNTSSRQIEVGHNDVENTDWAKASEDPLFIKKRAETLATLLYARDILRKADTEDVFLNVVASAHGRRAIMTALREKLKTTVSSNMMDVSICGAVAPYNQLLTGKLVALLCTAKEVSDAYQRKYEGTPGIIASQMAGRPIVKPQRLEVLTTTSLYEQSSAQYNRLKVNTKTCPFLTNKVEWKRIAKTEGFGSVQLSSDTVTHLREMSADIYGMQRINSRFGEGTNPRIRQIREGLEAIGVPPDAILHHNTKRILYGCMLMHEDASLPYAFSSGTPKYNSVDQLVKAWVTRWALPRIRRDGVLNRLHGEGFDTYQRMFWCDTDGQMKLALRR